MHSMRRFSMWVGALLVAGLTMGCAPTPSSYEQCNDMCEYAKRCLAQSDAQTENCHKACNDNRGALNDIDNQHAICTDITNFANCTVRCKNAGTFRNKVVDCFNGACNTFNACIQVIDATCVAE